MKYTIVVDSVAAIPEHIFKTRPIKVLPITIDIDGVVQQEIIDERELITFYKSGELSIHSKITTAPPSPEQISDFILNEVAPYSDYAICQTFSRAASPIYNNFEIAASGIAKKSKDVRVKLGIDHPFRMTYLNTGTGIAAQGLVAIYADILLSRGTDFMEYTETVEKFTRVVRSYAIVRDIYYSRKRALEKGIKSVGWGSALIGKAAGLTPVIENYADDSNAIVTKRGEDKALESLLRYAIDRIKDGLYVPVINISYAGDLNDLYQLPIVDELQETAKTHKVKILFGVMKLGSSMMYGPGGFSIGLAPKNSKDKPK